MEPDVSHQVSLQGRNLQNHLVRKNRLGSTIVSLKQNGKEDRMNSKTAKLSLRVPKQASHPQMPGVLGSPLQSPVTSRKALTLMDKRTPPPKPIKSAWEEKRKERSKDFHKTPFSHSVDQRKPKMVEIGIQSGKLDELECIGTQFYSEKSEKQEEKVVNLEKSHVNDIALANPDTSSSSFESETSGSDPAVNKEELSSEVRLNEKRKKKRISQTSFEKLGLARRPYQFKYEATVPSICLTKIDNPEPFRTNVWVTVVPKHGGEIKTPFYTCIDLPFRALRGDVIMKFETQTYNHAKLNLSSGEKLCSQIIDINMTPLAFSLHQEARLKMRILEDCDNIHEDVWIVTARQFTWSRLPTYVETREIHDGEIHYYAVCNINHLGKFAVITSQRSNKFVLTSAGGVFRSTISSEVTVKLEEGAIPNSAHVVELSVVEMRKDAINSTTTEIESVRGVKGRLVASSHLVKVRKEIQVKQGILDNRHSTFTHVHVTLPVSVVKGDVKDILTPLNPWKRPTIKIMKKSPIIEEYVGKPPTLLRGEWKDVTLEQRLKPDFQQLQCGGSVEVNASLPSSILVLVFDETSRRKSSMVMDSNLDEVCETLLRNNLTYDVAVMVHQKTNQPEMISVHAVPATAAKLIAKTMASDDEWRPVEDTVFELARMEEREYLDMQLKGPLQLTINQLKPRIQFHSRGWQGTQFQLEASNEYYSSNAGDIVSGTIEFIQRTENENRIVYSTSVDIPYAKAKPYKSYDTVRPIPKVSIYREYKLAWMKNLTNAEKKKYKDINIP